MPRIITEPPIHESSVQFCEHKSLLIRQKFREETIGIEEPADDVRRPGTHLREQLRIGDLVERRRQMTVNVL